ncbi:hypothetical protein [Bergeyella zoohelcum]|uniref:Uncharacterized protein n=1 Tax=Bergeyella zoohelcum TaxID=1015 RepID=A0A7Z9CHR6_9FLAO|nr:hypothetical protein [Bergeyella zoohelcum]VDH05861.1 Uncharacterised protein [Bergeyella zoohelcum]
MSPKELREFIHELKTEIKGINRAWLVIDDSQLVNTLEQREKVDNAYIIGVLPSYGTRVKHNDAYKRTLISQILILEKTDYSELTEDEFIDVFERTYQLAKKVADKLVEKISENCFSPELMLEIDDLNIVPVWKKGQCNGWSVEFSLE